MGGIFGGGGGSASQISPSYAGVQVQTSLAGKPISIVYGTTRVSPNLIWYGDFQSHAQHSSQSGGGKGGGGQTSTTGYSYSASVAMGLCAGPILGVGQVWQDKTALGGVGAIGASLFTGQTGQAAWPYLSAAYPAQALGYCGLAYVAAANMDMGSSASLSNYTFEVGGLGAARIGADASPDFAIRDILTSTGYGAGLSGAMVADLSAYRTWCANLGFGISPALDTQTALRDILTDWLDATQAQAVWSSGCLKIIPYGDAQPAAYGGSLSPVMAFSADDYHPADGEPPVAVTRADPADLYNQFTIEFLDRSNNYNTNTATSEDGAHIDTYSVRPEGTQSWHFLTSMAAAQLAADLRRNSVLGVLASYAFRLNDIAALLEPMDIVAITEPGIGLSAYPVRITRIEETDDGLFDVTAEDMPGALANVASRPLAALGGYSGTYGQTAPDVNAPVIFEPPFDLSGNDLEVWIAVSGNGLWGGCDVYLSDDGQSYRKIGSIAASARHGVLLSGLPAGAAMDTVNQPVLALAGPGQLLSGTPADAANLNTLCWVDGELLAYQTAALQGAGIYRLSTLVRGADLTVAAAHPAGASWCRIDDALFKYPFTADRIGQTLSLKFVSFNVWGAGAQSIADVQTYSYTLRGAALAQPLPNVAGLTSSYVAGITNLTWLAVSDYRAVDYEIRQGPNWNAAQVVGRTPLTRMASQGDGTYWVAAHYQVPNGPDVYSAQPADIVIAGSQLVSNVIAGFDEQAGGWTGAVSGEIVLNGAVELLGQGDLLGASDLLAIPDWVAYGGMQGCGVYQVPPAHRIAVGRVAPCQVLMTAAVHGQSAQDNLLSAPDLLAMPDLTGSILGPKVSATPQVRLSQDGVSWGSWQNWYPGSYPAMAYDFRVVIASTDATVIPILTGFSFKVDVPDRADCFTALAVPAAGLTVAYAQGLQGNPAAAFNGGNGGAATPNLQVTIVNAQPGDDVLLSNQSAGGFTVQIVNGGVLVARSVNIVAQGY